MIHNSLKPTEILSWNQVPQPTNQELVAAKAPWTFSASTSLREKIQRVFNGSMFFIAGTKLLSFLPSFAIIGTKLSNMSFAVISSLSLAQIPAVMTIMTFAPKIIVTLAMILVVRKVLAVAINLLIYQAVLYPYCFPQYKLSNIDEARKQQFNNLRELNFEGHRIALNKSGIDYDAFVFEHQDTKNNGQWVIIAGGNGMINEEHAFLNSRELKKLGFNVLFVNGPGVGRSSGWPTSYSIQAGQEAGLQFLENVVKAKKILLYGLSLGGGAQGEAIQNHQFKTDEIDYLVWTDRSFDKLSNAASYIVAKSKFLSFIVKPLFFLLGIELDGVKGAKKLQSLGITQIVTQNSRIETQDDFLPLDQDFDDRQNCDGVIHNKASLYAGLRAEFRRGNIQTPKLVHSYGNFFVRHTGILPENIRNHVEREIEDFLSNPL